MVEDKISKPIRNNKSCLIIREFRFSFGILFIFLCLEGLSLSNIEPFHLSLRRIKITPSPEIFILTPEEFLSQTKGKKMPLILGGTGFIASHLGDTLLAQNQEVAVIVRSRDPETIKNIQQNLGNKKFYAIELKDIFSLENLKYLIPMFRRASVIYHLAAQSSAKIESFADVVETFQVNSLLAGWLTKVAGLLGKEAPRVIYASSALLYAQLEDKKTPVNENTPLPLSAQTQTNMDLTRAVFKRYLDDFLKGYTAETPEEYLAHYLKRLAGSLGENSPEAVETWQRIFPEGIYSISKLIGESFVQDMSPGKGIILRLANVYGPRNRPDDVVAIFIERLLQGKSVFASTDTRNFVYVDDVAGIIARAGRLSFSENETFIVSGNERPIFMEDLLRRILKLMGRAGEPFEIRPNPVPLTVPPFSNTKMKTRLGFDKLTTLDEGLRRTIEWFRNNPG